MFLIIIIIIIIIIKIMALCVCGGPCLMWGLSAVGPASLVPRPDSPVTSTLPWYSALRICSVIAASSQTVDQHEPRAGSPFLLCMQSQST